MTEKTYVFDNKRERKINELYLNPKGSDVNFVFKDKDTEHSKKVPAHKIILCLDSPVFDRMFFGSLQELGDVEIVDAPVAAFKEFLQFFYLNKVTLSSANIIYVTNLCKKYEMDDFLRACEIALQSSFTIDDMCWGYSIAELMEQENLREFCAEKIKVNATQIIKSESFLECDGKSLSKIMTLVSSDWGVLERVIGYMEWSKAQCNRCNLDTNPKNLRNQLKDVFNEIPFHELSNKQLSQHVATYKGFFCGEELEELFIKQSLLEQPNPFDSLELPPLSNIPEATFKFVVHNFSELDQRTEVSPPCYIRNLPWRILVKQRTISIFGVDIRSMGFFVQCNAENTLTNWSCKAKIELRLLSYKPNQQPYVKKAKHLFCNTDSFKGYADFILLSDVVDPKRGYVQNDQIVVEAHVAAEEPQGV